MQRRHASHRGRSPGVSGLRAGSRVVRIAKLVTAGASSTGEALADDPLVAASAPARSSRR